MWLNEHVYNHTCDYIDFQQIVCGNIANQIHGFTTDYGKFILIANKTEREIRDHRYTQQKRLERERAMNKYTGKSREKKYHNKFHKKCEFIAIPRNYKSI